MQAPAARVLDAAPAEWAALLAADPAAAPSHRPELWAAFTAVSPELALRVVAVERDGRLIGGAPALLERRGGLHRLHALPMLLAAAPLALPGMHAEVDAAVAGAFAALAREHDVVGGEWALHRATGPAFSAEALALLPGETRWLEASVVTLEQGLDAAAKRIGRKHRQAMRQTRDAGLECSVAPPGPEADDALEAVYALHLAQSRRWGGHRALPLPLSRALIARGAARLFEVRRGGERLAGALALDGDRETFVWWSGTHAAGRRLGAFPLLLWGIVEWAAAAGRARVNLGASTDLANVASFKSALGAEAQRYPVRWLAPVAATPVARLFAALQARVRRGRARGEAEA
ncbi:MAG: GNAT family N-acetyltransferase [Candidatus Eisenbacteria bacterium]